jgi:hypothetical protein
LEAFLTKADSYGMKIMFNVMGNKYGTLLGVVAPMAAYKMITPYSSIENALVVVDKLGGNNAVNKNFIADPRIAGWAPINEARIDLEDVREWTIAVSERIKSYGGKVSMCVGWGDAYNSPVPSRLYYAWSISKIVPIISDYVDYLQAHVYCEDVIVRADSNPAYDMYTEACESFSIAFEYMVNGRGDFGLDKLMVTETGCGSGTWTSHMGTQTITEHQQAEYIRALFDTAKKYGIVKVFYFEPFSRISERGYGFIDYDGSLVTQSYNTFKESWD